MQRKGVERACSVAARQPIQYGKDGTTTHGRHAFCALLCPASLSKLAICIRAPDASTGPPIPQLVKRREMDMELTFKFFSRSISDCETRLSSVVTQVHTDYAP